VSVDGYSFFRSRGWTDYQSAGIMGNLIGESNLRTNAVGDGGKAFGVAQWHPDRQSNFKRVFGKDIRRSTLQEQYAFVDWELRNTEKRAGAKLAASTNVKDATYSVMKYYERPANDSSFGKRLKSASDVLKKGAAIVNSDLGRTAAAVLTGGVSEAILGATDAVGLTGDCDWLCQFKKWLEETAFFKRIALALVGLIVIVAAFYLLKEQVGAPNIEIAKNVAL
jgi:hypothetical protein